MAGDLIRLGQRIRELRGETPAAVVARRAGIAAAYLHAIEGASPNRKTSKPSRVSVPVLRAVAAAIPGARASELLELAGWDEDAVYDRVREAKEVRGDRPADPLTRLESRVDHFEAKLIELIELLHDLDRRIRGMSPDDGGEA